MRAFILVTALATATIHTVYAMPNSNLAVRSAFPDTAGIPHVSHPSHQRNRLHKGKKVGEGEQRTALGHAARGSVHLAEPREEQKAPIARREKTRRGVLRERTIKNADYGSGSAPAGEAVAHSQAEPAASPTSTPAAAPGPARISDDAEPPQAAHA
ncbi:hypothetical protein EV702DRAFT_1151919 [Suillus placidus]|uniref:Uncharacterized protein n=1 Tax=Suillus placidus TaxID=48579 RepID=A0A9P6ZHI6_9AGAM|nr:hypothetical protein EV702DRAFT_1151919 [Suillus placidus]